MPLSSDNRAAPRNCPVGLGRRKLEPVKRRLRTPQPRAILGRPGVHGVAPLHRRWALSPDAHLPQQQGASRQDHLGAPQHHHGGPRCRHAHRRHLVPVQVPVVHRVPEGHIAGAHVLVYLDTPVDEQGCSTNDQRNGNDRRDLPAGVGQVDRVVADVDIRMLRLRQRRQARERVPRQEATGAGIVPAGAQVV